MEPAAHLCPPIHRLTRHRGPSPSARKTRPSDADGPRATPRPNRSFSVLVKPRVRVERDLENSRRPCVPRALHPYATIESPQPGYECGRRVRRQRRWCVLSRRISQSAGCVEPFASSCRWDFASWKSLRREGAVIGVDTGECAHGCMDGLGNWDIYRVLGSLHTARTAATGITAAL